MASFEHYYPRLLQNEGGYCDTPGDAGGETYRGVARAYHPAWPGWKYVDAAKLAAGLKSPVPSARYAGLNKALGANTGLQQLIQAFYKREYWDVLQLDQLHSQGVAEQLADHGVNAGTGRPARMLQFCLNQLQPGIVLEDGQLGAKTIAAANEVPPQVLFDYVVALRRAFYHYRAGVLGIPPPVPAVVSVLRRLNVTPNPTQAKFLKIWLGRVAAIPYA